MGQIYVITNKLNNFKYVGLTSQTAKDRWALHLKEVRCGERYESLLHDAMRKYGIENFTLEVLEDCPTSDLFEKEKYYVKLLNTYYLDGQGYNLTYGGEGTIRYNDEAILSLWDQGLTMTEIANKLGAAINTICVRLKSLRPGEARERYSKSRYVSVEQFTLDGIYIATWESITAAAQTLSIETSGIVKCCQHERNTYYHHLWKYTLDNTPIEDLVQKYILSNKCCEVDLIDEENNIIRTYESGRQAELELNLTRGKISEVCNYKYGRKTVGGYRFQWHNIQKREYMKILANNKEGK